MYNCDVGSVSRLVLLVVRSKLTLVITGGNINLFYFFVESVCLTVLQPSLRGR
jgi:hypothetical protein